MSFGADPVPVRPDYARGLARTDAPERREVARFSRGQERTAPSHQKDHEGDFAVGQERTSPHPEREYHGRYSRGQQAA